MGRGSGTQLQVGENLNFLAQSSKTESDVLGFELYKCEHFYPLQIVGCGSEMQPQVGLTLNYIKV